MVAPAITTEPSRSLLANLTTLQVPVQFRQRPALLHPQLHQRLAVQLPLPPRRPFLRLVLRQPLLPMQTSQRQAIPPHRQQSRSPRLDAQPSFQVV